MTEQFWYTESQGSERDKEILQKYRGIIDHYDKNPNRITKINEEILKALFYNDFVIDHEDDDRMVDGHLKGGFHKILNLQKIKLQKK